MTLDFAITKEVLLPIQRKATAPLTLPKLELMGALTAIRFYHPCLQAVHSFLVRQPDHSSLDHTNTFVAHCVGEILSLSKPANWRYCPTQDNPEDLLTRDITLSQLKSSMLWKHGPLWFPSEKSWPKWSLSLPLKCKHWQL